MEEEDNFHLLLIAPWQVVKVVAVVVKMANLHIVLEKEIIME